MIWRRPLLCVDLEIPFVHLRTELMTDCVALMERRYILLMWQVWKWKGQFALYNYERSRRMFGAFETIQAVAAEAIAAGQLVTLSADGQAVIAKNIGG